MGQVPSVYQLHRVWACVALEHLFEKQAAEHSALPAQTSSGAACLSRVGGVGRCAGAVGMSGRQFCAFRADVLTPTWGIARLCVDVERMLACYGAPGVCRSGAWRYGCQSAFCATAVVGYAWGMPAVQPGTAAFPVNSGAVCGAAFVGLCPQEVLPNSGHRMIGH